MTTSAAERAHWSNLDPADRCEHICGDADPLCGYIQIESHLDLREGATILDLGCGVGRLTLPFARAHARVRFVGQDISPTMISAAREHRGFTTNAHFFTCDGRSVRAGWLYEAAFSMLMFQHIPDDAVLGYLRSIAQMLLGPFRFQWVEGDTTAPFVYERSVERMDGLIADAGLETVDAARDETYEQWWWQTVRNP